VTGRAIYLRRKSERQEKLLTEANKTVSEYEQRLLLLEEKDKQHNAFQESLNQAEITTKLQRSRLSSQEYNSQMSPPERYKYVHSLAASGMSSEEIASILYISIHEADQLVKLARLAHSD
jgi:DNA-binding NarL/FixJ family response regulator